MAAAIAPERATELIRSLNDPSLLLQAQVLAGDADSWSAAEGFINSVADNDDERKKFAEAPLWAGIVNAAGHFAASSAAEHTTIYNAFATSASYTADYNDITLGFCGFFDGSFAGPKYDSCTGIGSPKGIARK
jgi:hypothetical protein